MTDTIVHGSAPRKASPREHTEVRGQAAFEDLDASAQEYRVWSREEVAALRARTGSVSPWRVVAVQAAAGLGCCLLALLLVEGSSVGWSAAYGAVAVLLPSALLARGMTRAARTAVGVAMNFLLWEMLKIGASIAILVIAAKVVPDLNWPVLLVTMVVCMKVNWFALLWRGR